MQSTSTEYNLCTIQTTIPVEMRDEKMQMLHDMYGECTVLNERHTLYTHRMISIKISEPVDNQVDEHTITTLGEKKKPKPEKPQFIIQHAMISIAQGNPHKFFKALGCAPKQAWIERGRTFKHDNTLIKIYSVLSYDENDIDPNNLVVSIEELVPIIGSGLTTVESTSIHLSQIFTSLIGDLSQAFTPETRGLA